MGHSKGEDRKSKDTMACKYLLYSVSFDKTVSICYFIKFTPSLHKDRTQTCFLCVCL